MRAHFEVRPSVVEDEMQLHNLIELVPEVSPDDTFADVLALVSAGQAKVAAVVQDRKILGIIAQSDIARRSAMPNGDTSMLHARDLMTAPVETMLASVPVIDAARAMRPRRIQYLALVDDSAHFLGIATLRRVLFEVMDELDLKVDNLERELMADGPGG
jgi:CBS domain-containing protein